MQALTRFESPAPGAYSPERTAPLNEARAPAYSMGARTTLRKRDTTPGPNNYNLPVSCLLLLLYSLLALANSLLLLLPSQTLLGHAPAYSMTARSKIGSFAEG
jgi:hypothetical protein